MQIHASCRGPGVDISHAGAEPAQETGRQTQHDEGGRPSYVRRWGLQRGEPGDWIDCDSLTLHLLLIAVLQLLHLALFATLATLHIILLPLNFLHSTMWIALSSTQLPTSAKRSQATCCGLWVPRPIPGCSLFKQSPKVGLGGRFWLQ